MCARARLLDEEAAAAALVITERQLDPTRVRLLLDVSAEHLRHAGLS